MRVIKGTVLNNEISAKNTYICDIKLLDLPALEVKPGQFAHIQIPNAPHLLLRRPISIYNYNVKENLLSIIYQVVGKGTAFLSGVLSGCELDMLFPLGTSFPKPPEGSNCMAIGGGAGSAPLHYLMRRYNKANWQAYLGFRSKANIFEKKAFEQIANNGLYTATDDGTDGYKGRVIDLIINELKKQKPDAVYCCGPSPMMAEVQKIFISTDIAAYISLEQRMGCGIGACVVCSCKIGTPENWNYKRVCKDGPVFSIKEVVF